MTFSLLFLLMVLATYRLTRFAVEDTLIANQRIWVINKLMAGKTKRQKIKTGKAKIAYMLTCPYCASAWLSAAMVIVVDQFAVIPLPWLVAPAVWGGVASVWGIVED